MDQTRSPLSDLLAGTALPPEKAGYLVAMLRELREVVDGTLEELE